MEQSWRNRENLNKNEIAKLEKDGLEILKELDALAQQEFSEIDPMDIERLKWAGIYTQRPKNGRFLVRVKLPSGRLTAEQARVIAGISADYGEDSIQITIRQCIQVHNITLKDIPDIVRRLDSVGLTSVEGCGDVPRNILGNPLAGVDPEELFDTMPIVQEIADALVGNPEFSNLPRKYKISVSANPGDCGFAQINDLAFVPAVLRKRGETVNGFHVYVAGGLSLEPKLAKKLPFFLRPEQAVDVARAVGILFREYGYREKRNHCRMKYLMEDWGVEQFAEKLEEVLGYRPERGGRTYARKWNRGVFHGVHPQKQEGLYYLGMLIPSGSMKASDLAEIADLADRYGDGQLRTTNSQNLLILNIPEEEKSAVQKESLFRRYVLRPDVFTGYCASCTGNQYCSFAPIETKQRLAGIVEEMARRYPELKQPLRINLTGCGHACAHPMIADIGLTGGRGKENDQQVDMFTFHIGGALGRETAFGTKLSGRVSETHIVDAVSDMVGYYLRHRDPKEIFYQFVRRTGTEAFQEIIHRYI